MSKKSGFKLNKSGVRELLQSKEIQEHLSDIAQAAVARCGPGYASDVYVGKNRANAMVYADTPSAQKDNLEHNTILKAVQG